ncbi:MAG: hypothetical protein HBSAPP04_12800 [Ignavibacteriaceae bacterium]|nr:MAG: TerB family tellurite resistance protein [Chlorobiota bacterium]GJQ32441.1 MAG: hypothetical protein HBSAPP04_12800 [Ignavibacteriaceae bacterium]
MDKLNNKNSPDRQTGRTSRAEDPATDQKRIPEDPAARKNILSILAYLAAGDNEIHFSESDLIKKTGHEFGFTDYEIAEITFRPDKGLNVIIPPKKSDKLSLIYDLFEMMLVDGKVTIEEVAIITRISFLFGIPAIKLKTFYIQYVEAAARNITKDVFLHRMELFI